MERNNNSFSVLNMASDYAAENEVDVADLFKRNPVSGNIKAEADAELAFQNGVSTATLLDKPKKAPWSPDAKLTEGMGDINSRPKTYSKEELVVREDTGEMKNIADDNALGSAREAMDDMGRKMANINDAKKRFGIRHLQIPEGQFQAQIYACAGDTNFKRAKAGLDVIFQEMVTTYPEFILEWADPSKDPNSIQKAPEVQPAMIQVSNNAAALTQAPVNQSEAPAIVAVGDGTTPAISTGDLGDTKIIINKNNLPEVSWTKEEMDVIRRSRSIELNIVEDVNLKYTNIEDVDDNAVDVVLSQYQRKVNDVFGALPASKYRATFTGLTYTEILDLSHSQEMNSLDGERKKWAIAYDHIKNQSIGPWVEYKFYIDPETKKRVVLDLTAQDPADKDIKVTKISKFDDFISKTSFMDLEFILWKILCATAMDQEIISIDCHGTYHGKECRKSYDWIYSPNELLVTASIDAAIMHEMKKSAEVSSLADIQVNYKESMLNTNNTIELPTSKFGIVFGHISAYDYLNTIYAAIHSFDDEQNPMISQALSHSTLTVIKSFLIPKENGGHSRIKGAKNIIKIVNTLDEIDFQTISELMRIMIEPYQFRFALKDICCPQCKTKSSINIESMTRLLFIVAQSLSSVQVVLKRT
jgi:hypothetical protein